MLDFSTECVKVSWPPKRNPEADVLSFRPSSPDRLTLEMSASEFVYGVQLSLSTQLINPNFRSHPRQHHSFIRK